MEENIIAFSGGGDRENSYCPTYPQNLKFTTNKGQNTLLNQFKNALSDNNTQNLSFLIGFFRISGFIHTILLNKPLEPKHNDHTLIGNYNGQRVPYQA